MGLGIRIEMLYIEMICIFIIMSYIFFGVYDFWEVYRDSYFIL